MIYYRIKNWNTIYEVNRSRELKTVKWLPLPIKLSGDGYCLLMEEENGNRRKDGPAFFGTFIAIIELASTCNPRGSLIRSSDTPHTFESIGRICRICAKLVEQTILFCIEKLNWIEIIDLTNGCDNPAASCDNPAASCMSSATAHVVLCNVLSLKKEGMQGGKKNENPLVEDVLKYLNEKLGTHFRSDTAGFISGRLKDGYTIDDFKKVINKKYLQWADDEKMIKFLRPKTLFSPEHFGEYLNELDHVDPKTEGDRIDRMLRERGLIK
jgi:uncharacterized phage protein (TIGR02220 family)